MGLLARFNKRGFRAFARMAGWMLLFALFPGTVYAITESAWAGFQVFLVFAVIPTSVLLWVFWSVIFPKGGS